MHLNGNDFPIYLVDTVDDIIDRIAASLNTLPKWLIFAGGKPKTKDDLLDKNDIQVEDYLVKIRNRNSIGEIPTPYPTEVSMEDIYRVYIGTNKFLEANSESLNTLLLSHWSEVKNNHDIPPLAKLEDYWRNRNFDNDYLKRIITTLQADVRDTTTKNKYMENIVAVDATQFEITHVHFSVDMGHYDGTLHDLFDSIVPNISVPYARCTINGNADLFKIFQEFKFNPSWLDITIPDLIMLKVNSTLENQSPNVYKHYTTAIFTINDDNKIIGTFDTIVSSDTRTPYLSRVEFTNRVLQVFTGLKNTIIDTKDDIITSRFAIPRQCFDASMFADMVMINRYVSDVVVIDEFINASRKTNTGCYVKLLNKPTSAVGLSLRQTERAGEYGMRSIGEWYVLCRTRTSTTQDIVPLQQIILKIFHLYNEQVDKLSEFYRRYINFTPITCTTKSQIKKRSAKKCLKGVRAVESEIFPTTYSRYCQHQPVIIDDEKDAVDKHGNKLQIMRFPTKGEIASDGMPYDTRMYVCKKDNKYIYPGVRDNKCENKEKFPYLPCCFKTDQTTRVLSDYQKYFFDKEVVVKKQIPPTNNDDGPIVIRQNPLPRPIGSPAGSAVLDEDHDDVMNIEKLEKTMQAKLGPKFGKLDVLPEPLVRFFSLMDFNPLHIYMRCGIRRTRYSSIEAIMYCRGEIKPITTRIGTIQAKLKYHTDKLMANIDKYAISAKQEFYNQSIQDIKEAIKTDCLVPSKYIHLIESLMDCNIFVFTESGLFVPDHSRMYMKYRPKKEVYMFYEHSGNIVELIGFKETHHDQFKKTFYPSDPADDIVIANIYMFFRTLCISYYKRIDDRTYVQIPEIQQLSGGLDVTGQILDDYGKCRVFIIDDRFTFVPDVPIPPYAALLVKTLPRASLKDVLDRFRNIKILWKKCTPAAAGTAAGTAASVRGCREIGVRVQKKLYTILVNDNNNHRNIVPHSQPPMYEQMENDSVILKFQHEKKDAYDLLQKTITILLSLIDDNRKKNKILHIDDLLREYAFTKLAGGMTPDNIRLLYTCKQWIKSHKKDTIPQLSLDVLKSVPMTYTFNGIESVKNLIKTYDYNYTTVFDRPRLNYDTGYRYKYDIKKDGYIDIEDDSSELSNCYRCKIVYGTDDDDIREYPSVEHAYQRLRFAARDIAKFITGGRLDDMNDENAFIGIVARDAMKNKDTYQLTPLQRVDNNYIMNNLRNIMDIKFKQERFKQALLATGKRYLAYQSTVPTNDPLDKRLGCRIHEGKVIGQNYAGLYLMEIRDEILEKQMINMKPYFFKCNDVLYLAIPTKGGLDMANQVIYSWVTTKSPYNLQHTDYTYKVMVFDSPNNLKEVTVVVDDDDTSRQDGQRREGGIVLFVHEENRYEALLEL
jgi:Family of unknown function (DUF5757)